MQQSQSPMSILLRLFLFFCFPSFRPLYFDHLFRDPSCNYYKALSTLIVSTRYLRRAFSNTSAFKYSYPSSPNAWTSQPLELTVGRPTSRYESRLYFKELPFPLLLSFHPSTINRPSLSSFPCPLVVAVAFSIPLLATRSAV